MDIGGFLHKLFAPKVVPVKRKPRNNMLRETDWLKTPDIKALLAAGADAPRTYAILAVLVGCGLRCNELRMLDLEDYFPRSAGRDATIQVRFAKGSKERTVPAPQMTIDALDYWLDFRATAKGVEAKCEGLFRGRQGRLSNRYLREIVKNAGRKAGLGDGVHPHMLRHTFATHLTLNGVAIEVVQVLCGHVSIGTTQFYVAVPDERRFEAVGKLDFAA